MNEPYDPELAREFFEIVQQPSFTSEGGESAGGWSIEDRQQAWQEQRAAFNRDLCTAVSGMVAYAALNNTGRKR
jgi:hypothetical protein